MSLPLPDAAERSQALDLSQHVLVMAPAGSGKTGLLVSRMLRALATADEPEQVVAITFTNKAAAEIRNRVLELLQVVQQGHAGGHPPDALAAARQLLAHDAARGWQLLDQPDRLRALTIDSFNGQLAAQLPLLSGMGGPVRVSDDAWALYAEAVTRAFAELEDSDLPADDRGALELVLRLAGNRLDRLLPALIDLLSRREQWRAGMGGDDAAESQLLHELVERGLHELREALGDIRCSELASLLQAAAPHSELLAWCHDLHAWPPTQAGNLATLRKLAELLVTAAPKRTLRKAGGINIRQGFGPKLPHTLRMKQLLERLEGDTRVEAACGAVLSLPDAEYPEQLKQLQRALQRTMRRLVAHLRLVFSEAGQTDFAEVALSAGAALRPADGQVGDALLSADRRIRHLLVDEMQDTSKSQVALLEQLTAGWEAGDGRSLFLVGDPQQSIYAFREADVRLFLRLWGERRLGDLPLRCLRLSANFRSSATVVGWFNDAFTAIFPARVDLQSGAVPFSASAPQRAAGAGRVDIHAYAADDEDRAAAAAADAAASLVGDRVSVVVLGRTRGHLTPVIRALRARGLVPACQDIDPLLTQPAVRDYVSLARALWHPEDRLHWAVLLRAPFVGLGWADLLALSVAGTRRAWPERIAAALDPDNVLAPEARLSAEGLVRLRRLADALQATGRDAGLRGQIAERAEALWHVLGGAACVGADALADVQAAMRLLRRHTQGGGIDDLEALERGLGQLYAEPRAGQVQVMTVHKAKGLEFDHVIIVGGHRKPRAEDQPLWHLRSIGGRNLLVPKPPDSFEEEGPARRLYDYVHRLQVNERRNETLRLLYVAATRAKLSLSFYLCADLDSQGAPAFATGSFAALLAPVIGPGWQPAASSGAAPAAAPDVLALPPPLAPRLPVGYAPPPEPVDTALYRPQERRTLKPSEAVLNAAEDKREDRDASGAGDLYAQLVGTLYHQALERIANGGEAAWTAGGAARGHALASGFRRLGLPEPQVEAAVARVLELVERSLASDTARRLLAPRRWARNEYHVAGYRDGRWVAAVIDRCFEDDDGRLWVIDYKTAARALPPDQVDAYVADGVEKYRAQLGEYARLLAALRPGREVRAALYFAEADRLVEVPTG